MDEKAAMEKYKLIEKEPLKSQLAQLEAQVNESYHLKLQNAILNKKLSAFHSERLQSQRRIRNLRNKTSALRKALADKNRFLQNIEWHVKKVWILLLEYGNRLGKYNLLSLPEKSNIRKEYEEWVTLMVSLDKGETKEVFKMLNEFPSNLFEVLNSTEEFSELNSSSFKTIENEIPSNFSPILSNVQTLRNDSIPNNTGASILGEADDQSLVTSDSSINSLNSPFTEVSQTTHSKRQLSKEKAGQKTTRRLFNKVNTCRTRSVQKSSESQLSKLTSQINQSKTALQKRLNKAINDTSISNLQSKTMETTLNDNDFSIKSDSENKRTTILLPGPPIKKLKRRTPKPKDTDLNNTEQSYTPSVISAKRTQISQLQNSESIKKQKAVVNTETFDVAPMRVRGRTVQNKAFPGKQMTQSENGKEADEEFECNADIQNEEQSVENETEDIQAEAVLSQDIYNFVEAKKIRKEHRNKLAKVRADNLIENNENKVDKPVNSDKVSDSATEAFDYTVLQNQMAKRPNVVLTERCDRKKDDYLPPFWVSISEEQSVHELKALQEQISHSPKSVKFKKGRLKSKWQKDSIESPATASNNNNEININPRTKLPEDIHLSEVSGSFISDDIPHTCNPTPKSVKKRRIFKSKWWNDPDALPAYASNVNEKISTCQLKILPKKNIPTSVNRGNSESIKSDDTQNQPNVVSQISSNTTLKILDPNPNNFKASNEKMKLATEAAMTETQNSLLCDINVNSTVVKSEDNHVENSCNIKTDTAIGKPNFLSDSDSEGPLVIDEDFDVGTVKISEKIRKNVNTSGNKNISLDNPKTKDTNNASHVFNEIEENSKCNVKMEKVLDKTSSDISVGDVYISSQNCNRFYSKEDKHLKDVANKNISNSNHSQNLTPHKLLKNKDGTTHCNKMTTAEKKNFLPKRKVGVSKEDIESKPNSSVDTKNNVSSVCINEKSMFGPKSPLHRIFLQDFRKIQFSQENFEQNVETLFFQVMDSSSVTLNVSVLLFHVLNYLHMCKENIIESYSSTGNLSALFPLDENCITTTLFLIELEKKLEGLMTTAVTTFHHIIISKKKFTMLGLASLCRVFTQICKCQGNKIKPVLLCGDLLKIKHKYAPYLIASIAGVWKELFQNRSDLSAEEVLFHSSILYGASKKTSVMNYGNWQSSMDIIYKFFTALPVNNARVAITMLKEQIQLRCKDAPCNNEYLASALIILAGHEEWKWTKENVIDNYIVINLNKYGSESLNENAFDFYSNMYVDAILLEPGNALDFLLSKFFDSTAIFEGGNSVQESAALALMRFVYRKNRALPPFLNTWFLDNHTNPKVQQLKPYFQRRLMGKNLDKLQEEDVLFI